MKPVPTEGLVPSKALGAERTSSILDKPPPLEREKEAGRRKRLASLDGVALDVTPHRPATEA